MVNVQEKRDSKRITILSGPLLRPKIDFAFELEQQSFIDLNKEGLVADLLRTLVKNSCRVTLTPNEAEAMLWIASAYSRQHIADVTDRIRSTVDHHINSAFVKIGNAVFKGQPYADVYEPETLLMYVTLRLMGQLI